MSMIITVVACLVALYVIWVITKKIVMAIFFALVVGALVYVGIPMLAERDDGVGDAAKSVNEVRKKAQKKTIEVMGSDEAKAKLKQAKEKAAEIANDPAVQQGLKQAVETGKKVIDAAKSATEKKDAPAEAPAAK
jgi:hypothetical protein